MRNFLLFLVSFMGISPVVSWASTVTANSCSYADVSSAVTNALAGDTVSIPSCSSGVSWSSTLTITKSITLSGAGGNSTKLINSGSSPFINISLPSDVPVRVTGIYFDQVTNTGSDKTSIFVSGKTDGSFGVTKIRIDHNTFNKGKRTLYWYGWAYGVADHNNFINCDIAIAPQGDDNYAWIRPIQAGTADAVFIEDNNFTINNSIEYEPNEQIYHQDGARSVTRNNTFDARNYTAGSSMFFESHGNLNLYAGNNSDQRGHPLLEIYNNNFYAYKTYRMIYLRGGSTLVYNNTMTTQTGSASAIELTEEEDWTSGGTFSPKPAATSWSAQDQINNSFFWNNTINGSPVTAVDFNGANDNTFIQQNRDYFMHAPQATGGKEQYTGRAGGAMTFSSSGANAYYPYVAYTYPHPLTGVSGTVTALNAPQNLKGL
ncbi:MAG: hypothetical protein ACXVJM_21855 [Mucilaginibacter sp.]